MGYTNIVSSSVSSERRIEDSLLKIYQIEGEAWIVSSKEKGKEKSRIGMEGKLAGQSGVAQACPTAIKRGRRYSSRLIGFH